MNTKNQACFDIKCPLL